MIGIPLPRMNARFRNRVGGATLLSSLGCVFLLLGTTPAMPAAEPAASTEPVAIVIALAGEAQARHPGAPEKAAVTAFDWFPAGTEIATGEASSLELIYRSGARWRLGAEAGARLGESGPEEARGVVERLADLPEPPPVARAEPGEVARAALTAVRIRSQGFSLLYPAGGARTLADSTRLYFQPELPFDRYRVTIEDEAGRLALDLETRETLVEIPPGVLEPGSTYFWGVRTRDALGHLLWEEARFETLPDPVEERRQSLRRLAEGEMPAAMLAALDVELGLWWEARATLEEGLRKAPGDEPLAASLERLDRWLGWGAGGAPPEP